jgi:hypothetical protein
MQEVLVVVFGRWQWAAILHQSEPSACSVQVPASCL